MGKEEQMMDSEETRMVATQDGRELEVRDTGPQDGSRWSSTNGRPGQRCHSGSWSGRRPNAAFASSPTPDPATDAPRLAQTRTPPRRPPTTRPTTRRSSTT